MDSPTTTRDKLVGTIIDRRYKVLAEVGEGARSRVLKAEDQQRSLTVGIKVLHSSVVDAKSFDLYRLWVEHATTLVHPNIVRVFSCESSDDGPIYLVTDFVQAKNLEQVLAEKGKLPENVAISIIAQVCDALDHAHMKGIPHNNLKPNNIMLITNADSYMVKLADFGVVSPKRTVIGASQNMKLSDIAKAAQGQAADVEARYQSPEQKDGRWTDARSDLYSVGCLLYQCLTGKTPSEVPVKQSITGSPRVVPPLSAEEFAHKRSLDSILERALAGKPAERYQQSGQMSSDLNLLLEVGTPEWENKAECLKPVVPVKPKSAVPSIQFNIDLRLPLAIAAGLIAIPLGGLITIAVLDIKVPALMPYEVEIQERVFAPTDPRYLKNLAYMIDYYKSQRKYAEAWAYKNKVLKATERPLTEQSGSDILDLKLKDELLKGGSDEENSSGGGKDL